MTLAAIINPFFAARFERVAVSSRPQPRREPEQPRYARLPLAPRNASPVPHLTSLYHFHRAGEYGDRSYPGNCGGNLIKDLLLFFKPGLVLDPMSGSGTCSDVCAELGIACMAWDIHRGIDACDPQGFSDAEAFDFIWAHPPYWRMKMYADDARDLSRAPTLEDFVRRYRQFIRNCFGVLKPHGKLAILMGLCGPHSYVTIPTPRGSGKGRSGFLPQHNLWAMLRCLSRATCRSRLGNWSVPHFQSSVYVPEDPRSPPGWSGPR